MNTKLLAAVIVLSILLIAFIALFIYMLRYIRENKSLKEEANFNYNRGKLDAEATLKQTVERFEFRKEKINELSDREILTDVCQNIYRLAARMDRIERGIGSIADHRGLTDELTGLIKSLRESTITVKIAAEETEKAVSLCKDEVNALAREISSVESDLGKVDDFRTEVTNLASSIDDSMSDLEGMDKKLSDLIVKVEKYGKAVGQNPLGRIDRIEKKTDTLIEAVGNLADGISDFSEDCTKQVKNYKNAYGKLANDYKNLNERLEDAEDENRRARDEISNLQGELDDAGDEIRRAKDAADDALAMYLSDF